MTVDLNIFLLGVALLWFPRPWMRRGFALLKRRRRSTGSERVRDPWKESEPGDPRVDLGTEFAKIRNYVDLLRGIAGSLAIWGGLGFAPAIAAAAGAPKITFYQILGIKSAVTLAGLLIQAVRVDKHRISFFPPIFYLAGMSVAMCGYRAAGFAFVLVWAVNAGLGNTQAFLAVYAVVLYVFGGLFVSFKNVPVAVVAGLAFLPVLLSLLARRPLVIYTRRGSRWG